MAVPHKWTVCSRLPAARTCPDRFRASELTLVLSDFFGTRIGLTALAESIRKELGDSATKQSGSGVRRPGMVSLRRRSCSFGGAS